MMNLKYTLYICLLLLAHNASGQYAFAPEKLSADINSPYPEFNPQLSPDGKTLYFVRANHPQNTYGTYDTQDIWYSELQEDGSWSEARHMPEHLNKNRYNAVLGIFHEGNSLLLHGRYNKRGNIWKKRGFSVSHKSEKGWSKPQPLKVSKFARKNKGQFTTATISDDGQYLIISFSKRYNSKQSQLYVSRLRKNGRSYTKPKSLKKFSYRGVEEAPFLSPDGKTLYFANNITGAHRIYKMERKDEKGREWSKPTSVSDSVNSAGYNSYFRTNYKGTYGYFARSMKKGHTDIYQVKLIEENPYILVKGQVLSSSSGQPLKASTKITFYANDTLIDSVEYQPEQGTFQAWLPLGKQYELSAHAYSHVPQAAIIDARGLREYAETEQDLLLEPQLLAKIEGLLLIRSSNSSLPAAANPKLLVNGQAPDSLTIDPVTNRYQLWLPYGQDYQLQVEAKGFKPELEKLKLSHIDGYTELSKNLYVDVEKTASISGTIFDKKTGKAFAADIPIQVILNDSIEASVKIDGESRSFSLQLPLGTQYTINAKAEGYYPMIETLDLRNEEQNVKVLKDLYLAPIEIGQSIRLNNVFFETAKANLKTESYPELDRVITFLEENPKMKIEIAGHTDNVGSKTSNLKLSAARAKSIEAYMVAKGISDERISSKGYGSNKPEADNDTELGRSLNRRVEFTILEIVK